ncbi:MAG: hypothetical protein H5U40_17810, partial [Polyangiaceae bacterium]|nr:hypothetical protein [Polyangiaceae bacterium]
MPRTSAVFALVALLAGCPASPRDDRIELLVRIDAAHDAAGGRDTEVATRAIDALRATEVRPSRRAARDACVEL